MIAMVAAALIVAGVITLLLTIRTARRDTKSALVTQAQSLASVVQSEAVTVNRKDPAQSLRTILRILKTPLNLQQAAVVAVGPQGRLIDVANPAQPVSLPSGLTEADLDTPALVAGKTVSGRQRFDRLRRRPLPGRGRDPPGRRPPGRDPGPDPGRHPDPAPTDGGPQHGHLVPDRGRRHSGRRRPRRRPARAPHHPTPRGGRGDHPPDRRR